MGGELADVGFEVPAALTFVAIGPGDSDSDSQLSAFRNEESYMW